MTPVPKPFVTPVPGFLLSFPTMKDEVHVDATFDCEPCEGTGKLGPPKAFALIECPFCNGAGKVDADKRNRTFGASSGNSLGGEE